MIRSAAPGSTASYCASCSAAGSGPWWNCTSVRRVSSDVPALDASDPPRRPLGANSGDLRLPPLLGFHRRTQVLSNHSPVLTQRSRIRFFRSPRRVEFGQRAAEVEYPPEAFDKRGVRIEEVCHPSIVCSPLARFKVATQPKQMIIKGPAPPPVPPRPSRSPSFRTSSLDDPSAPLRELS